MSTATLTLTEFLLARLDEDEGTARPAQEDVSHPNAAITTGDDPWPTEYRFAERFTPARVLAECEAKRLAVAHHFGGIVHTCPGNGTMTYYDERNACPTIRALALPYADHPDYREEWRP